MLQGGAARPTPPGPPLILGMVLSDRAGFQQAGSIPVVGPPGSPCRHRSPSLGSRRCHFPALGTELLLSPAEGAGKMLFPNSFLATHPS